MSCSCRQHTESMTSSLIGCSIHKRNILKCPPLFGLERVVRPLEICQFPLAVGARSNRQTFLGVFFVDIMDSSEFVYSYFFSLHLKVQLFTATSIVMKPGKLVY